MSSVRQLLICLVVSAAHENRDEVCDSVSNAINERVLEINEYLSRCLFVDLIEEKRSVVLYSVA